MALAAHNDSLLHVDSVNANDNKLCNGNIEFLGTVPLKLNAECDVTFSDSRNTSEPPNGSEKTSEKLSEIDNNTLNILSQIADENHVNIRISDSCIPDSENNIVEEGAKLKELIGDELNFSDNVGVTGDGVNDAVLRNEDFHDVVQFFKDLTSLTFLENAGSSNPSFSRSSCVAFNPLHAKLFPQSALQPVKSNELHEVLENKMESEVISADQKKKNSPDFVNKHIKPCQSLGNVLITFESPTTSIETKHSGHEELKSESQKIYTEEELQQALKIKELQLYVTFLKKEQELEISRAQKQAELEKRIVDAESILKEVLDVKAVKEKALEQENCKLKEDLKTAVKKLQSKESTIADYRSRYEQCKKDMLKFCTESKKGFEQLSGKVEKVYMEIDNALKIKNSEKEIHKKDL